MSRRPVVIGVTALLALGAAATGAQAQTSTIGVSALATSGSRQFFVEDLSGTTLTALDLGSSGQGQLFQTRVKDTDFKLTQAAFTASAEMTNLYKKTGQTIDYSTKVPSSKISVAYAAQPTDLSSVSLAALPKVTVAGVLPTCSNLSTLLPQDSPLRGVGGLLGGLTSAANPLCTALGGVLDPTGPAIEAVDGVVVPLAEQIVEPVLTAVNTLPLAVGGSTEPGAFTNPSYLGDGDGDSAKTGAAAATPRKLLAGTPNSALNVSALISSAIDGKPLFPAAVGGTGALTTVAAVVSSMQGSADAEVARVGNALAGLTAADQTGILSGLTSAVNGTPIATLTSAVLDRISGTYRSFPRLTADLSGAPSGTYTGTMTITFVQQ